MPEDYEPDAQGRAFREAGDADHWDDNIDAMVEQGGTFYDPIESVDDIDLPDVVHATEWDADRLPPKTLEEAKAALAHRIADPAAPDGPESEGAYDDRDPEDVKGPSNDG